MVLVFELDKDVQSVSGVEKNVSTLKDKGHYHY